jgi:hypothetical protein
MPGQISRPLLLSLALVVGLRPGLARESSIFDKLARQKSIQAKEWQQGGDGKADEAPLHDRVSEKPPPAVVHVGGAAMATSGDSRIAMTTYRSSARQSPYLVGPGDDQEMAIDEPFVIEDEPPVDDPQSCAAAPRPLWKRLCNLRTYLRRPLQGQSWLSRPMSAGFEFGGIWGGELIRGAVDQSSGPLYLVTIGWDHTNCDGYEVRFGGSIIDTFNEQPPLDPRNTRLGVFDVSALLYPWGDARLRPFGRFGIGLHEYKFVNHLGQGIDNIIPAAVLGAGVKYLFQRHCALRMEFVDNIGFGDGLDLETIHNTSLTFGIEYRFGGAHKNYWPWSSGRLIW